MPTQLDLIQEAYNRGILPPDKQPLYEEAVRRGLIQKPLDFNTVANDPADAQTQNPSSPPTSSVSDADLFAQAQSKAGVKTAVRQQADQTAANAGRGSAASSVIEFLHPAGQVQAGLENALAPIVGTVAPDAAQNMREHAQTLEDTRGNGGVASTVSGLVGNLPVMANPLIAGTVAAGETYHQVEQQKAAGANISGGAEALDVVGQGVLNAAMSKLFGANVTGGAAKPLAEKLAQYVPDMVAKYGARGAVGALINAGQQLASNAVTGSTVNPNQSLTEGVGTAALLGGGMEMGFGALHDATAPAEAPAKAVEPDVTAGATFEAPTGTDAETAKRLNDAAPAVESGGESPMKIQPSAPSAEPDLSGATFESPTVTDPRTKQAIDQGMKGEADTMETQDRPKGDLSFKNPKAARTLAENRSANLNQPMYVYAGGDGKYYVDSRQPGVDSIKFKPEGGYEVAKASESTRAEGERRDRPDTLDTADKVADWAVKYDPDAKTDPDAGAATKDYFAGELKNLDGGDGAFKLVNVPVENLSIHEQDYQTDKVAEYAAKDAGQSPPLIGGERDGKLVIVDGNTRGRAAIERGDKTVKMYVPEAYAEKLHGDNQTRLQGEAEQTQKVAEKSALKATPVAGTSKRRGIIARTADNIFTPIMSRVRDISPPIFDRMMRTMEFEPGLARENEARMLAPVAERMTAKLGGPKSEAYGEFWLKVRNGDFEGAKKMVGADDFEHVTEMLDRLHAYQKQAGVKLGKLENYWPDYVTDYKGLDAAYGDNLGPFEDAWKLEEKRIGRPLSDQEKMEVANSVQQGYGPRKPGSVGPSHARTRVVKNVTADQLQYRLDPFSALFRYLDASSRAAGRAKFLGKSADLETLHESIGDIVQKEVDAGRLDKAKQEELKALLHSRLMGDTLHMNPLLKKTKDLVHLLTLGQVRNTINQVLDFAVTASSHGTRNAVRGTLDAVGITPAEKRMVLEDIGIHEFGEEYRDVSNVGRIASKALKATGFQRLDRLGKESRINSALSMMRAAANDTGSEGFDRLKKEYGPVLGDQFDRTMADLREGRKTENVRYLMMLDLTKVQPVTLSNMPKTYLDNPNGRIMYTLKSFQLQQLDWMRRDIVRKLASNGERRQGLSSLASLVTLTATLGVGKEIAADVLRGRNVDPDKVPNQAVDNLLGLVGMNRYFLKDASEKPVEAAIKLIEPNLRFADDVYGDVRHAGDGKGLASVRYLPLVGDPLYYWSPLGKGFALDAEQSKKDYRGRLNDMWSQAYQAKQAGDTDTAHDALRAYNERRRQGPGDGRDRPLSMDDLNYLPPASEEKKDKRALRQQAADALKAGDRQQARELLREYNKGLKNPASIASLMPKSGGRSDQ